MNQSTIEIMFSPSEWHETMCAHCTECDSCVSMADVPTCYGCLEKYYDEDGEPLPQNVYLPEPVKQDLLNLRGSAHEWIINTLSDPVRVISLTVAAGLAIGHLGYFGMVITAAVMGGSK